MSFPVTAIYAGLLALLLVVLSFRVSAHRRRTGTGIGRGRDERLHRAIRAHGNFVEYVPLALVLLLIVEASGQSVLLVHGLGIALFAGRVLHALGLSLSSGASAGRVLGTLLTWLVLLVGGLNVLLVAAGLL